MIVRGTTPYHNFILPLLTDDIDKIYVTYYQNGQVLFEKTNDGESEDFSVINLRDLYENASMEQLSEEDLNSSQLTIHLTQEETLLFTFYPAAEKNIAVIQIRALDKNGEAYASFPIQERIFGVLKDGVIGDETEE